jgi:HEPN domain-containing protein
MNAIEELIQKAKRFLLTAEKALEMGDILSRQVSSQEAWAGF